MITIETTAPPCDLNVRPKIENIWKYYTLYLINSNKLDTSIDGKFTDNLVVPPIFTEVPCDKLSESSIQDLYTHFLMNLAENPVNIPVPKFFYLELSTIDSLYKCASLWTPSTRVGRPTDVAHWSAPDLIFGETTANGDAVRAK